MYSKIRFFASLGWANGTREEVVDMIEIGYEDWDAMTIADQEKACQEFYDDWVAGFLDAGWHEEGK